MRWQWESIHIALGLVLWPYNTSLYLYFPSWGDFFKVIFSHFVAIVDPSMNKGSIGCFNNCNLSVHSNTEVLVCVLLKNGMINSLKITCNICLSFKFHDFRPYILKIGIAPAFAVVRMKFWCKRVHSWFLFCECCSLGHRVLCGVI